MCSFLHLFFYIKQYSQFIRLVKRQDPSRTFVVTEYAASPIYTGQMDTAARHFLDLDPRNRPSRFISTTGISFSCFPRYVTSTHPTTSVYIINQPNKPQISHWNPNQTSPNSSLLGLTVGNNRIALPITNPSAYGLDCTRQSFEEDVRAIYRNGAPRTAVKRGE